MLPITYAPYAWLVFVEYPWTAYHWHWVRMWPLLPGLMPGSLMGRTTSNKVTIAATITVISLVFILWIGSRSRRSLIGVAIIVLLLSIANGFATHGAFRM